MEFRKPEEITTIELLEEEFKKVLLLKDEGVVRMLIGTVIASRMNLDPLWLMLVAAPSSGKTELIMTLEKISFVHFISDLTVNAFASGMKRAGKETSLLFKIQNGVMAMKDFTSILGKNKETRGQILAQMREIFDGEYDKKTGTGDDIKWKGKICAIAGATEAIYQHLQEFAIMGDRFIMYNIIAPDRKEVLRRALKNAHDMSEKREHLKSCVQFYIEYVLRYIEEHENSEDIALADETENDLIDIADLAAKARSAVGKDFKTGLVDFVPTPEVATRIMIQLHGFASAFIAMNRAAPDVAGMKANPLAQSGKLTDFEKYLLYKTAFDSIPRTRRDVLLLLAKYMGGVSTKGAATMIGLPSESVKKYLSEVSALKVCVRIPNAGPNGDTWKIHDEYRKLILKLEKIDVVNDMLVDPKSEEELMASLEEEAYTAKQRQELKEEREMDSLEVHDPISLQENLDL